MESQSPQEYFRLILLTVVGQAFSAAGYELENRPMQWASGLFRFAKALDNGLHGFIEFQLLYYAENSPSRFQVILTRTDQPNPNAASRHPDYVRRTLSQLVVDDFGVAILPAPDHWWTYSNTNELGHALGEAGSLAVGYGMPWLSGDLLPPLNGQH
jgi:hypothetical protein